jgi:hypothetical protein
MIRFALFQYSSVHGKVRGTKKDRPSAEKCLATFCSWPLASAPHGEPVERQYIDADKSDLQRFQTYAKTSCSGKISAG